MEQLKAGIKLLDLPNTSRDAVEVTQRLGLQCIWIDALRIAQDDREDWAEQSAQMSIVYGQSWLTIAAQESKGVDEGCIYSLPDKLYDQVSLLPHDCSEAIRLFVTDVKDFRPRNLSGTPLNSRAWTFQERILSTRTLFLCKTELKFECREMLLTEHGHRDDSAQLRVPMTTTVDETITSIPSQMEAWSRLVREHNGRTLTQISDRFPALAGVASQFQKHTNARYAAGIWSNALLESMLFEWAGGSDSGSEEGFYRGNTAPSWSWAAHYGGVTLKYQHFESLIAEVVDWNVVLQTSNQFGKVSSSWLKLRAPLLSLRQRRNPNRADAATGMAMYFDLVEGHLISAGDSRVDFRMHRGKNPGTDPETAKLYVLVVCWRTNFPGINFEIKIPEGNQVVTGMIVTPTGPQGTEMHRVGVLSLWGEDLKDWNRLMGRTTFSEVVLV